MPRGLGHLSLHCYFQTTHGCRVRFCSRMRRRVGIKMNCNGRGLSSAFKLDMEKNHEKYYRDYPVMYMHMTHTYMYIYTLIMNGFVRLLTQ